MGEDRRGGRRMGKERRKMHSSKKPTKNLLFNAGDQIQVSCVLGFVMWAMPSSIIEVKPQVGPRGTKGRKRCWMSVDVKVV